MPHTLTYTFDRPVTPEQLQPLFEQTTWAKGRSAEDIQHMLDHTTSCLTVWQGDRLVGFARVITDDVYRGLLDDVIVDTDLRGQGIGAAMIAHIIARFGHLEELLLGCLDHMVPFYEKLGFKIEGHPHMAIKNLTHRH